MWLDLSNRKGSGKTDVHFSYSGFMEFRCAIMNDVLWKIEWFDEANYKNYSEILEKQIPKTCPLYRLLNHSDCDWTLRPNTKFLNECLYVKTKLKNEYLKEKMQEFIELVIETIKDNSIINFS